eukprot:1685102-Pyramimonas_sp.AAC.1
MRASACKLRETALPVLVQRKRSPNHGRFARDTFDNVRSPRSWFRAVHVKSEVLARCILRTPGKLGDLANSSKSSTRGSRSGHPRTHRIVNELLQCVSCSTWGYRSRHIRHVEISREL